MDTTFKDHNSEHGRDRQESVDLQVESKVRGFGSKLKSPDLILYPNIGV
jgi:hypothetical protein